MDENFIVVLFKNKVKKKIINKFVTFKKADAFYKKLLKENESIIFDKRWENANSCVFELALLEKKSQNDTIYKTDDLGRNVKVILEDDQYSFKKIERYKVEEKIFDIQTNKKISIDKFIRKYLDTPTTKLVSSLNNKIVVQSDDNFQIFSTKNTEESHRLLDSLTKYYVQNRKGGVIFVKDIDVSQRSFLYRILEEKGYDKKMLYRSTTTHRPR